MDNAFVRPLRDGEFADLLHLVLLGLCACNAIQTRSVHRSPRPKGLPSDDEDLLRQALARREDHVLVIGEGVN